MMKSKFHILVIFLFLFHSSSSVAKLFASQYCEFQLPDGWQCALEGTEWVCQSTNAGRKKEAIIILAAKIRGGQDSLDQYQAYLKKQKTFRLPDGKTQVSDPKYAKISSINGHRWVDSLHLASEVPGFYTRYMATVKEDLGVAVTFSVAKDQYANYQAVFDKIIKTLKVFRTKAKPSDFVAKQGGDDLLNRDTEFIPGVDNKYDIGQRQKGKAGSGGGMGGNLMYIALAAVAGFVIMKMKKGKGGAGKKKKKKKKKS